MNNTQPKRIFIGLAEVAGFGAMYKKGLKKLGHKVSFIISKPDLVNRNYPCDKCLDLQKYPSLIRLTILTFELLKNIFSNDYFIFLYGKSFWPGNYDLPIIKLFNKKIMAIFLGCEIRQREEILKLNRLYCPCSDCKNECDHKTKQHIAKMFEKYADIIICQPENAQLLTKHYEYAWVPIDTEEWKPLKSIETNGFKITHAPSSAQKKGTTYIQEAIERLKSEGYEFNFFLAQKLEHSELKKHLLESDLIIDQLMIGWHGKLSVECMSIEKPVICWLDESLTQFTPDIPIISANPETIYEKLKHILDNKDELKEIGLKGRDYVKKHHDYIDICENIIKLFEGNY